MVFQNTMRLNGSVHDNIAFGAGPARGGRRLYEHANASPSSLRPPGGPDFGIPQPNGAGTAQVLNSFATPPRAPAADTLGSPSVPEDTSTGTVTVRIPRGESGFGVEFALQYTIFS